MADIARSHPPGGGVDQSSTTEQAKQVGRTAQQAGGEIVGTAKEQGKQVAEETRRQARDVYGQFRSQLSDQAHSQQKNAVGRLYGLRDEVNRMAEQGAQNGPATDAARQVAGKIDQLAHWLENREPGHVVDEVKSFARRRPGVFLAGAAVLGVLAGRVSKNLTRDSGSGGTTPRAVPVRSRTEYDVATPPGYTGNTPVGGFVEPVPGAREPDGTLPGVAPYGVQP